MALYEYLCPACRKGFELMRPMSDARKGAVCPGCGSEAQKIISGGSSMEHPTQAPTEPSIGDSETRTPTSEARAANQRIAMSPAPGLERSTGPHGGPSQGGLGEDMDLRRSAGSTAVRAPTVVREGVAADSEVDLKEDTAPLEMAWLTESQPGGGNLWYIRDWGIASMFGYLREKRATEAVGKLPFPPAGMDPKLAEPEGFRQVSGQQRAALVEPDSAAGPADDVGSHPTFSEWRAAISIMPWLQETGMEPSEADKENPDIVSEESDMLGLPPRRDRGTAHLPWARWHYSRPAGEHAVDVARRSRPAKKERIAADFPDHVIEAAWRRQGGRCAGCGRWLIWPHRDRDSGTGAWESHHRVPVDQGGSHLLSNCVLFCSGVADCHFNWGHEGIGWTHYATLDETALVFLFAGSATVTSPTTPVRPKRSLLRGVFGIPQPARGQGKPRDESGGRDSTG
jgi:putative FmdB family regulatory protein